MENCPLSQNFKVFSERCMCVGGYRVEKLPVLNGVGTAHHSLSSVSQDTCATSVVLWGCHTAGFHFPGITK